MTSSNIFRWGGIAAMLGGVLWVVWSLLVRVSFEAAFGSFAHVLLLLAALLTLAGLSGLHASTRQQQDFWRRHWQRCSC
jgi:ABC-type Na+ efflux pump permease subunit